MKVRLSWRRIARRAGNSPPNADPSDVTVCFRCRLCGASAGSVHLAMPGEPTPLPDQVTGAPPGAELLGSQWARVVVPEFGALTLLGDDGGSKARAYAAAIRTQSADDLYSLSPDAVPLWCPHCRESYCRDHWVPDGRLSTSDNLYGRCPSGHLRRLWGD